MFGCIGDEGASGDPQGPCGSLGCIFDDPIPYGDANDRNGSTAGAAALCTPAGGANRRLMPKRSGETVDEATAREIIDRDSVCRDKCGGGRGIEAKASVQAFAASPSAYKPHVAWAVLVLRWMPAAAGEEYVLTLKFTRGEERGRL